MIEIINSKDLKTDADLVCTHCGKEHFPRVDGRIISKESIDYVFEKDTDNGDEWCICVECKEKCDAEDKFKEKAIELIKYSVDYLLGVDLRDENGWSEENIKILEKLRDTKFNIQFEEE